MCGRFSYPGVMEAAYGKWGYHFLSLLQFMYPFLGKIDHFSFYLPYREFHIYSHGESLFRFIRVMIPTNGT